MLTFSDHLSSYIKKNPSISPNVLITHTFPKKSVVYSNLSQNKLKLWPKKIIASILHPSERSSSRLNSLCSIHPTSSLCRPPSIRFLCTLAAVISALLYFIKPKLALWRNDICLCRCICHFSTLSSSWCDFSPYLFLNWNEFILSNHGKLVFLSVTSYFRFSLQDSSSFSLHCTSSVAIGMISRYSFAFRTTLLHKQRYHHFLLLSSFPYLPDPQASFLLFPTNLSSLG